MVLAAKSELSNHMALTLRGICLTMLGKFDCIHDVIAFPTLI